MKEIKLALLGKNIKHSKSQMMYEDIFKREIDYKHYDCESEDLIPSLDQIFSNYQGLSITAPYKKFFLTDVEMKDEIKALDAINCIKKSATKFIATNTDYEAIVKIFKNNNYAEREIIILGSGSMAHVTSCYLKSIKKSFSMLSRKVDGPLENRSLIDDSNTQNPLIINTCARQFVFEGDLPKESTFWDYNYAHLDNKRSLNEHCNYVDGLEMLRLQAESAVDFWGLRNI